MIPLIAMAMIATLPNALVAEPFPLSQVRLLPGRFLRAQEANASYLLMLEPDRLLSAFRKNAGLEPKAPAYGGWESMGVAGHTLGHYLTACSLQFAASGDARFRDRVKLLVAELKACQDARKDGYVGAIPDGDRVWQELERREIQSKGFDLNGIWVPWYTLHKLFAGLLDAHRLVGDGQALGIAAKLGDWAIHVTRNLDGDDWQRMLACEHGGMNESLAELSVLTGDPKYLALARKFHHDAVLSPLKAGEDRMAGLHSNTQIPKVIGLARLWEIEGKAEDRKAAEFFWDRIANHRSYVIGGNSNHEHLTHPDRLTDHLSDQTAESCNTYNMLKLTRHLFAWSPKASYFDFYERALLNHILASQNPEDGMMMYFMPLRAGAVRNYSTPFESFWCCVGTGIENHTKYAESVYFRQGRKLFVNLFLATELDWKEHGIRLRQETAFPDEQRSVLWIEATDGQPWPLAIRKPAWLRATRVKVNGRAVEATPDSDGYVVLERRWKAGDRVEVALPLELRVEPMPDQANRVAFLAGPVVLAAEGIRPDQLPILVSEGDASRLLRPIRGKALRYRTVDGVRPAPLRFLPYADVRKQTHATYFDLLTQDDWRKEQARIRAEAAAQRELRRRTVDEVRVAEMQPERDHAFAGEQVQVGEHQGRKWRHAVGGGWFSYRVKVLDGQPLELVCTYWGSDAGRTFDLLVDGQLLATQELKNDAPGRFFDVAYPLPAALTKGKTEVEIRFQAKPGSIAGGLYGLRVVKPAKN